MAFEQSPSRQPAPSDAEVIVASWETPERFALVVERHFSVIYGYLARRVGPTAADDLTAETFGTAFEQRRRYRREYDDARPWLFGIAVNLLRRHYRRERRELHAFARTGTDPLSSEDSLAPVLGAERVREVAAALAQLSGRDREILLLWCWGSLSYEGISVALSIPVGTVRSRLSRARARMRELLEPSGQSGAMSFRAVASDEGE